MLQSTGNPADSSAYPNAYESALLPNPGFHDFGLTRWQNHRKLNYLNFLEALNLS